MKTIEIDNEVYDALEKVAGAGAINGVLRALLKQPTPIPTPVALEIFYDENNEDLIVDNPAVYDTPTDPEMEMFVLSRGYICVRNYTYPTTDHLVMRLTEDIIKTLKDKEVL